MTGRATGFASAGCGLLAAATLGCAMTPLQAAMRAESSGEHPRAATLYAECIEGQKELDCYTGLGELERPDGAMPSCARFEALAADVKARHGSTEAFQGPHVREHLSAAALHYPDVVSVAEWFDRVLGDCRIRDADRGELRASRKQEVLSHPCARRRAEAPEALDEAARAALTAQCEDFRKGHLTDTGIDRETDQAIGEAMAFAAVLSLDDDFVEACASEALRTVCPNKEELTRRMQKRVRALAESSSGEEQLRLARSYLKRWPAGPDAEAMRLTRERVTLDIALERTGTSRSAAVEEFLRGYPESPLRHEALEALWAEAKALDSYDRYRDLVERYPDAPFVAEAKARIKKGRP